MKIFKIFVAAIFFVNASLCLAGSITGKIAFLSAYSGDINTAPDPTKPPTATLELSPASTCFTSLRLLNLNDEFQKQAYAALLTAQTYGWNVALTYKVSSNYVCTVTSVRLIQ